LRLYVHFARLGLAEAAALYAAMRYFERAGSPSGTDLESDDESW
jgi:hypothetical protein